jgi:hypothetical protein
MENAMVGVLAALTGSTIGGLAPVMSNYVLQRGQTKRDLLNRQITQRETLYSDFIKEASSLYANSVTSNLENLDCLVSLYALVSRIRLTASEPVLDAAEAFVKQIVQHYGEPNRRTDTRCCAFSQSGSSRCVQFGLPARVAGDSPPVNCLRARPLR